MDFKATTLIGVGFLLVVLAFSMLGLAADNMAYVNGHQNDDLQIHYIRWNETAGTQYSYHLKMDYEPSRFTLSKESAEIASGVICAIAGATVVALASLMRKSSSKRFGLSPWLISLVLATTAFAVSLAVAVYAWQPVMKWDINFLKSLPVPSAITGVASDGSTLYQSPFDFTPEIWNCHLAPYATDSSTSHRLQALCQEARAARSLTIPIVIFAALMSVVAGWGWWTAKSAATTEPEKEGKDVEEVSMASKD